MFGIHVIDTGDTPNRFRRLAIFGGRALFDPVRCGFATVLICLGMLTMPALATSEDAAEYIKSLPAERAACRDKFRTREFEEAGEACRAWVTLAPDLAEKTEALSVLGQLYATAGDMDEAKAALDEAASYVSRGRDAATVEKWVRMQALRARLAEGRDQLDEANLIYSRTEERVKIALGLSSPAYALAAENRAAYLARQGDMQQASVLYTRAIGAYDAVFGPYNERSLETMLNLAVAQIDHQQKAEAERTLLSLLGAMKLGKRDNSEGAAEALTFLGNLRVEKEDFRGALNYYRQALKVRQAVHGGRDLRTAQSLNSAGIMYVKLKDYKRAEEMLSAAYSIRVSLLGPDDTQTISSLDAVQAVIDLQKNSAAR